jgi:hypothetical protein
MKTCSYIQTRHVYIVRVITTLCKPNDNIYEELYKNLPGAFFVLLRVAHVRKMKVRVYLYGVYNAASSYKI